MSKPKFYHAGCPVCVSAEQDIINLIGSDKVEVIYLGQSKTVLQKQSRKEYNLFPPLSPKMAMYCISISALH